MNGRQRDLRVRTKDFALRVIRLCSTLPKSGPPDVIGRQLVRCGTSVGAQYREAHRARSIAEFISKLESAIQELDETVYWIELLVDAKIIAGDGFSKKDVQKFVWERAAYRMKDLPDETFAQRVKRRSDLKLTRDSVIPVTDKPEDILVIVAGGDGSQSQYIHVWGQSTPEGGSTRSVTKLIRN